MAPPIQTVYGVDFSGAAKAGRNAWIAECRVADDAGRLRVARLDALEKWVGTADREPALAGLVELVRASDAALWAIDFPFGLPIELGFGDWPQQLDLVRRWDGGAYAFGLHCLETAKQRCERPHVRRVTDVEEKAPFDCYHYRIIYQTFHGMRDVLAPLEKDAATAVLPFQPRKRAAARRLVVEACPSSTLKRLKLPHQNYKQPAGGPLTAKRRATRRVLLADLRGRVEASETVWRRINRNPGGDALDAVVAAVGGWGGLRADDRAAAAAAAAARNPRYRREGMIFA